MRRRRARRPQPTTTHHTSGGVASSTTCTSWHGLFERADAAYTRRGAPARIASTSVEVTSRTGRSGDGASGRRWQRPTESWRSSSQTSCACATKRNHDKRTGLLNAAAFEHDLLAIDGIAEARGEPYAVVLCDIDFFHGYNERYLFQPANETLRRVADALTSGCRAADVVYRYGGEEMIVLLPRTESADAFELGERLRARVAELNIPHENRPDPKIVTVSVGISAPLTRRRHRKTPRRCRQSGSTRGQSLGTQPRGSARVRRVREADQAEVVSVSGTRRSENAPYVGGCIARR